MKNPSTTKAISKKHLEEEYHESIRGKNNSSSKRRSTKRCGHLPTYTPKSEPFCQPARKVGVEEKIVKKRSKIASDKQAG